MEPLNRRQFTITELLVYTALLAALLGGLRIGLHFPALFLLSWLALGSLLGFGVGVVASGRRRAWVAALVGFSVAICSFCLLTALGLDGFRGLSGIHGGSEEMYARGRLTTLSVASPEERVVVVVLYPRPIDLSWNSGVGYSGNGDDTSTYEDYYQVRFRKAGEWKVLTVKWRYSARTRTLRIGDATCDVPKGKVAVIRLDDDGRPTCSAEDSVPETVAAEKRERDREIQQSQPALPWQDSKD